MNSSTMMLFCGDPHGRFNHILKAANLLQPIAVILLGDIEPSRPLHDELSSIANELWYIHGNHDTDCDRNWANVWGSKLTDRNIDGKVVTLPNGMRIAGLGGVFRESVWYPSLPTPPKFHTRKEHVRATARQDRWQNGVQRKHWSTICPDELDRLPEPIAAVVARSTRRCTFTVSALSKRLSFCAAEGYRCT